MKKITILFLICLCFGAVRAQVSSYVLSQTAETYLPVVGIVSSAAGDDGSQNNIPIGFNFAFNGTSYTTFSVNVNGWIRLGQPIGNQSWVNMLGIGVGTAPLIAAYWDDHNRNTGTISYAINGNAPNRTLEVGWDNINISTNGGANAVNYGAFKLVLHEASGAIDFVYGSLLPGGQLSASVGLNDATSFLSITPGTPATASSPANNNITNITELVGQKLTFTPPVPCGSVPVPGNTVSGADAACTDVPFVLSLENEVSGFGVGFQWQSSQDGVNFTDMPNLIFNTASVTQSAATYYRCLVSCGAESTTSTPVQVMQNVPSQCYCVPTYTNGVTDGDLISNVEIQGTTLSNFTGSAEFGPSYTYYTGQPNYTAELQAGIVYNMTVTVGAFGQQDIAVWIDFDDDGVFEEDEKIGYTQTQITGGGTGTFAIELPCDRPAGTHRMRIRDAWNTDSQTMGPCVNYGYGETEDYDIPITAATGCERPAALSVANVSASSAVLSWNFSCGSISWDVHVAGHAGEIPVGDPSHPGAESGILISGLEPHTGYVFYVRANCAEGATSDWAGPFQFTTLPLGVDNDDCETATTLVPGGNFAQNAVVATNVSATKTLGQPNPTCGQFNFGGDVWFSVVVPEDGSITIEVQSNPGSLVVDTAMSVFRGDCSELTALGCSDDEGVGAFSMLSFTGLMPGETIYARVWEYANDTYGTFQVSAWNASLRTNDFDKQQFKYHPNPVRDFLNLSYHKSMTNVTVFNLLGQQVLYKTIGATEANIDLSGLSQGMYTVRVNAENQTQTLKIIKE